MAFSLILACGSTPQVENASSNTELTVTYQGKEVHRRGSKYAGEPQILNALEKKEPFVVIFSAEWCSSCRLLDKAITQAKLKADIYYINMDEDWVQRLAKVLKINSVPLMIHVGSKGQTLAVKVGPGQIITYLLVRY